MSFTDPKPGLWSNDQSSQKTTQIDQIELEDEGLEVSGILNQKIYFSVYGAQLTQYKIMFDLEYKDSAATLARVEEATKLPDQYYENITLFDRKDEKLHTFKKNINGSI